MPSNDNIPDRWDPAVARDLDPVGQLVYRSNLLGSDLRITNFAGGNTSAKVTETDPLTGEDAQVLWVKGSGGDLGSAGRDGFASLYLERLEALKARYRGRDHEDEMVGYLPHCTFGLNPRAASIDTPLHAFVPHAHVDHMHPDAVIAIAAAADGERITAEIFEGTIGWLPWQRPGFDLGLAIEALCRETPELQGIVLGGHGLFTWAETSEECYRHTLRVIRRAAAWLAEREPAASFGGPRYDSLPAAERRAFAIGLLPALRGRMEAAEAKVGHFVDSDPVLEFVNSARFEELAALGTSCPDHFLRTKIKPMIVPVEAGSASLTGALARLDALLDGYREDYGAYYDRCKDSESPAIRGRDPVVVLIPGVGMLTFAANKPTARIAAEFYVNAINVMRGATAASSYVGLSESEAFGIEYWKLEEAKLKRQPPAKSLAGRVALITGAGGGIGGATAERLLSEGACVMLTDIDASSLEKTRAELSERFGHDVVSSVTLDVTDEASVQAAMDEAVLAFGGLDILVSNAGIASASRIEDTTLEIWNKNLSVLTTGYFLVSRAAFEVFRREGRGGSIVFIGSKNALAASPGAAAYCTAKSAELHLARCLALEGAPEGIRVNVVNPDAVLSGSHIWTGDWRKERADAYGIGEDDLEEHYRKRSLLGRSVLPQDVAEAVYFLASDRAAKSTGNILNVDAGNVTAFSR